MLVFAISVVIALATILLIMDFFEKTGWPQIAALPLGLRVPFQRWHRPAMAAPFNRPGQASRTRGARITDALRSTDLRTTESPSMAQQIVCRRSRKADFSSSSSLPSAGRRRHNLLEKKASV
jgi:hypothetical protein